MRAAETIASLVITGLPRNGAVEAFERFLGETPPAGLLLFRRDHGGPQDLRARIERLRSLAPRPLLLSMDEEGGLVTQLAPELPVAPSARVLGRAASAADTEELGAYTGRYLRALGVDVDFAPVLDVDAEQVNPVIGPRAFSADPGEVATHGLAFARGLARAGVLGCAKHFPGHGDTRLDSHLILPRCEAPLDLLERRDLAPFRAAVAADVPLVMAAHVHYPALCEDERPASLSPRVMTGLLRDELGFRGTAITDALEMKAVFDRYPPAQAARLALDAGNDVLLYGAFTPELQQAIEGLARDLEAGDLALGRRVEQAAERVAALRRRLAPAPVRPALPDAPPLDLEALCRRSLRWVGEPPRAGGHPGRASRWLVIEPAWPAGPALADLLAGRGWQVTRRAWEDPAPADWGGAEGVVLALARRVAPSDAERSLAERCAAERPTWVVALAQDAFLAGLPRAAGRLSACDPGEPMRRAVAAALDETAGGRPA